MAHTATLHVKLDSEMDEQLKRLAASRQTSKGQLVREAVSACYRTNLTDLPLTYRQALSAYQGGFISIGRLARTMGMHVLDLRRWLNERDLAQTNVHGDQDAVHA
jgi:hypothetical protein